MRLKNIILKGFKSFSNKTSFDFTDGLNIIIGPNGSGKSNVVDAIRWVIGEKSIKTLRGHSMEDVIFKGAENVNPANFAEVTLLFSNKARKLNIDSDEIEIKRVLVKDKSGKFYINGKTVRMKEIQKLLGNIGFTSNGYSIIQQGEIEKFINYSSGEKRILFEEAAGIIPEKMKKKETENQLNRTIDNLKRIEDIIEEKKKVQDGLKRSLGKLNRYNKLKEELIERKNNFNGLSYLKYKKQQEEFEKDNPLLNEKAKLLANITKLDGKLAEENEKLQRIWKQQNAASQKKMQITNEANELQGKKNLLDSDNLNNKETIKNNEEQIEKSKEKKKEYENKIKNFEENKKEWSKKYHGNNQNIDELKDKLKNKNDELNEINKQYADIEKQYIDFSGEISSIENEKIRLSSERSGLDSQITQIGVRLSNFDDRMKNYNEDKNACKGDLDRVIKKLDGIEKKYSEFSQDREQLESKKSDAQTNFSKASMQVDILKEKKSLLEDSLNNYSIYDTGIKNIMKKARDRNDTLGGMHDVVANLIEFSQEYAKALEVSFGKVLQYVICDVEEDAKRAIKYLNRIKGGRVTFIPLRNANRAKGNPFELPLMGGIVGFATELYSALEDYKSIIDRYVSNVIIVKDMNVASDLKKALRGKFFRIVTVTGEVFHSDGRIVGGKRQRDRGILSLKGEYDSLADELSDFKKKEKKYREEFNQYFNKIEKLDIDIKELEIRKRSIISEKEDLGREFHEIEVNIKNLKENRETEIASIEVLKKDIERIDKELKKIVGSIKTSEKENTELKTKYDKYKNLVNDLQEEIGNLAKDKDILINENKIIDSNLSNSVENILNFKQIIENEDDDIAFFTKEIEEKKISIKKNEEIIKEYEKNIFDLGKLLENDDVDTESIQEDINKQNDVIGKITKDLIKEKENLEKIEEKIGNFLQEKQKINVQMNIFYEHLNNYFNDYEKLNEFIDNIIYTDDDEIDNFKRDLEKTQEKIERLGPVNFEAEKEYEEFSKEYEILIENYNDVSQSAERLKDIIEDVDQEMAEKFGEAVKNINEYFSKTFGELFEGGEAEIKMLDSHNLLETGIDISAKLPGKKVNSLNLLSGGEKALVTGALIFAIFLQNPTPVCIFDEVDSPMDEANLVRFFRMIRKFSKDIQFIIITHNKKSMEFANTLYGITMAKKGISKVISIEFEDNK
ncbi:chromosome segregation protein SMC [bacterium]|nr:chromosome segregation protein SMC [bacterium]